MSTAFKTLRDYNFTLFKYKKQLMIFFVALEIFWTKSSHVGPPELSGGQFGPFIKVQKLVFRKSARIEKNIKDNISLVSNNGFFFILPHKFRY